MTNQPKWQAVAQLGDVNPLDYGGYWVLVDTTGEFTPEGEFVEVDEQTNCLTIYRFSLEQCSLINGVLSDNKYHSEYPAWFAEGLESVAAFCGVPVLELRVMFCADDPVVRARAYGDVASYHGWNNLDDDPLVLSRSEGRSRYRLVKYRVKVVSKA
jgi:hypothetical protein